MTVKAVPDGYHTVSPYLTVENVPRLLDFVKQVFEAEEKEHLTQPDGSTTHAEVVIGDSVVMMGQARGEWKPMPGTLYVYVEDTDVVYKRALEAGASSIMEPADQFYGDRNAGVRDPLGNNWWIATHIEDVFPDEMQRRMAAMAKK